jgi:hypothetical protein
MPQVRKLQSWLVVVLVGSWLATALTSSGLALADPAPNLHHPAIILTARYAVVAWFAACFVILGKGLVPVARLVWVLGVAMHAVHVLFAFGLAHEWSHGHAFRRVEEVGGFGEGIFVSHAFLLVWAADALWWCVAPTGYGARPAWVRRTIHGFLAFVVFNSTVVFGPLETRIGGMAIFVVLLVCLRRHHQPTQLANAKPTS